jgi:hypothetical protein
MSGGATGGVQNYKGVMLCNRPADDAPPTVNPAVEAPRFRPGGLASEPIGLNPAKENLVSNMQAVEAEAARRRAEDPERLAPDTVMTKHKRWLAEMSRKKAALNAELADSAAHAASERKVFQAYTKTLRQAVRERSAELAEAGVPHAHPKMRADPPPAPPAAAADPAAPSSRPPSSGGGAKKKKGPSKPKWAMTETEADDIEEEVPSPPPPPPPPPSLSPPSPPSPPSPHPFPRTPSPHPRYHPHAGGGGAGGLCERPGL